MGCKSTGSRAGRRYRPRGLDHGGFGPSPEALEPRLLLAASVLTYHNDGASTGQDIAEATLTPADVNPSQFGKLTSVPLDGQVYAQPLEVPGVSVSGQGIHNVVYVATENDSLYAIDADTGALLWKDSFINPAAGITTVPSADTGAGSITPQIGITSTPVIDPATGALYLVADTRDVVGGVDHYVQTIHAININSGAEMLGGPVVIADTSYNGSTYTYNSGPSVAGDGAGSINGVVTYNALRQLDQRAALTLADGNIYIASASFGDIDPYHGWIIGYSATTLALTAVFNADPNGSDAGIWESGGGLAVDSSGDMYFETGNGTFETTLNAAGFPIDGDYGDSFVKVAPDSSTPSNPNINGWGLKVVDYFSPSDQATLNADDEDLGSGGPMLLPASAGDPAHPSLLIGSGKEGRIYLIDANHMGHYDPNADHVVQESAPGTIGVPTQYFIGGEYGTASYFNGSFYYGGLGDHIKQFSVGNAAFNATPTSESPNTFAFPGTTASITAEGGSDGILWALDNSAQNGGNGGGPAVLYAYDASNLSQELYSSAQASGGRDRAGAAVKFSVPTVANGKVYVGGAGSLTIYGLLSSGGSGAQPVNLSSSYNRTGLVSDGTKFGGGMDGDGYAISANLLGPDPTWAGTAFAVGPANAPDVVSGAGQSVPLPAGQDAAMELLATGVNGSQPNLKFTVYYTDGTSATFTQSVSDWAVPQGYSGESVAVATSPYRDASGGTEQRGTFRLYGYILPLDPTRTVSRLALPSDANFELVAASLVPAQATTPTVLSGAFNQTGIYADGATFSGTGGLDGAGGALSANLLRTGQTWDGHAFLIGPAGASDVVSAVGQTIALTQGQFSTLSFLATATNGSYASQTFTVNYTDGTTQTFSQGISNWNSPQGYAGEAVAIRMPYKDLSNGTTTTAGGPYDLYGYVLALNPSRTVKSLTLPNQSNIKILAIDLLS